MRFNKVLLILLTCMLVFTQCMKRKIYTDDTYFNTKVIILGHRGMGVEYYKPENTLESIVPAIGIGADGCEIDIQMTKDSVLVLYHDPDLSSTTTCFGKVHNHTWSEIRNCEYVSAHNNIYVNSLDEVFSKLPDLTALYFSLDCKIDEEVQDTALYRIQFLRAVKNVCEKHKMTDHVFIEGDRDLVNLAKQIGIGNKLFMVAPLLEENIIAASDEGYFGLSASMESLEYNVALAHSLGLRVMSWSPNNYKQNKELLGRNVDIIQTDDPISLLKFLDRYNYEYTIP